jgi:uncharacterized membrane protein
VLSSIISTPSNIFAGLEIFALFLEAIGVLLVIYGSLLAIIKLIGIEFRQKKKFHPYEHAKRIFIQKMIFGLDFFVAADLLRLVNPTMERIITIGAIVIIRTILSFSLSREIHLHKD